MKKLLVLIFTALSAVSLQARYHSIESEREFEQKVDDFDFSLVCFVDSKSHSGDQIKEAMRDLAASHDFKSLLHDRFGFLYVRADRDRNHALARRHGYDGKPLFIIFEGDHKLKTEHLSGQYSRRELAKFIDKELSSALDEIKDDVRAERKEKNYKSKPRVHIGFGTGYYPGYGYYRGGRPYWHHRRYGRHHRPYRRGYHRRPGFYFGIGN